MKSLFGSTVLAIVASAEIFLPCGDLSAADAAKTLRLAGTVRQVSTIPEARKSNYPDCYYTILLELGATDAKQEVVLLVKCFEDKKDILTNRFQKGDAIAAECVAFDDAPEKMRQTQQSDQIERYDLNMFFATGIAKASSPGDLNNPVIARKADEKFIAPLPIDEKIKREIAENIKAESSSVSARLRSREAGKSIRIDYSGTARERLSRFAQSKNPNDLLYWENDKIVRLDPNFIALDPGECNDRAVDVITSFDRELKKRNIRFIFVSTPRPWEPILPLAATNITPQMSFDATRLKTVAALLENGVEVIELGHYLYERPFDAPYFFDILANDDHPMDTIVGFLADLLKERLKSYDFDRYEYPAACFVGSEKEYLRKNKYPEGNGKFTGVPMVHEYAFRAPDQTPPVKSPVFIIGDSFSQTPWQTGGIRSCLGAKTRLVIDGYQVQSGSTRLMRVLSARNYAPLSEKQVVIMVAISQCFSPSYMYWEALKTDQKAAAVIRSANCPESWKPSVESADDFLYFDTKKQGANFVTELLELELPGFKDSQNCEIAVQISTRLAQFRVFDRSRKMIVRSGITDASGKTDSFAVSIPYDRVWGEKVLIQFLSQKPHSIKVREISVAFSENPKSTIEHGPGRRVLTFDDFKSKNKKTLDERHVRFDGAEYFVETRKFLKIRPDSRIVFSGKIRNAGSDPIRFSYGLALYDANGNILSPQNYPFRDNRRNYAVVAAETGKRSVVIARLPDAWAKGCVLARSGKDVHTRQDDILGVIENIERLKDGSAVVTLKQELRQELKSGENVRINNPPGSYLFFGTAKLAPGGEKAFAADISRKGACSRFSIRALPDGACYVKPIVFAGPAEKNGSATIDISEFEIKY